MANPNHNCKLVDTVSGSHDMDLKVESITRGAYQDCTETKTELTVSAAELLRWSDRTQDPGPKILPRRTCPFEPTMVVMLATVLLLANEAFWHARFDCISGRPSGDGGGTIP